MNKKEQAKYESLRKWLTESLLPHTQDDRVTVTWDSEDCGIFDMFFDCDDEFWAIGFETIGARYCIADMNDCEDMSVTDIKQDLKERIEVMQVIEW